MWETRCMLNLKCVQLLSESTHQSMKQHFFLKKKAHSKGILVKGIRELKAVVNEIKDVEDKINILKQALQTKALIMV